MRRADEAGEQGWVRVGCDLNSGWYCTPTNQGWSGSSTISTSAPSGLVPVTCMPSAAKLLPVDVVELVAMPVPLGDVERRRSRRPPCCRASSRVGWAPSRIVPPLSVMVFCSSSRQITGCGVSLSNSLELARSRPTHVAGELGHGALHSQADAEEGNAALRGRSGRHRPCPRCPARRTRRAPGCRRRRPAAARALRVRRPRCGCAGCAPGPGGAMPA